MTDRTAAGASSPRAVAKKRRSGRAERRARRERRRSRTAALTRSNGDSTPPARVLRRRPRVKGAEGVSGEVAYGALGLLVLMVASSGLMALTVRLDRKARGA